MTKEVKIPQISEGSDEATVAEIHVSEGDKVEEGQELIAVESDKASVDIPNEEGAGTVEEIKVSKGDTVSVGDVILILETDADDDSEEEEDTSDQDNEQGKSSNTDQKDDDTGDEKDEDEEDDAEPKSDKKEDLKQAKKGKPAKTDPQDQGEDSSGEQSSDEAPAAPLAKKFARELGVDINQLAKESKGRVTRDDVMQYAKKQIQEGGQSRQPARGGGGVEPIELPDFSKWGETEREPLSGIRTTVARNTVKSWQNIPHVTQHDKADITELQVFREKQAEKGQKASVTAMLTKICLAALKKFPQFNASLDMPNRELVLKKYYNIGIAADTQEGLMMPVIKNVDQKSLAEVHEELKELADKARNRKLKPEEMQGGNFTISNLGGIGGTSFTPVIFPPQVAILGVSAASIQPKWIEDEFVPSEIMTLSLSYDHRVIDGADAARFLRFICDVIEEPLNLLG